MSSSNILVFGQFTNNRGDQAQGVALAYAVKDLMPAVKVRFVYFQRKFPVHENSDFIDNIFISVRRQIIESLLCYFTFRRHPLIEMIKDTRLIVLPPGGPYIGDFYSWQDEFFRAIIFFYAKRYKKKTMIYGPSMGPFDSWWRKFLHRYILKKADTICVRDRISHKWAQSLGTGKMIHLTADAAIQKVLEPDEIRFQVGLTDIPLPCDRIKIGITPIDLSWHPIFGQKKDSDDLNNRIVCEFAKVIYRIIKNDNVMIYFYPQLYGHREDVSTINKIIEQIKVLSQSQSFVDNLVVLDNKRNADYQQAHISNMDYFIGTRYHSIVFSAMYTIPFISIYYEHKTEDISKRLGMGNYSIPIDDIDSDIILEKLKDLKKNRTKIVGILKEEVKKIRKKALETATHLYELYTKNN